MLEPPMKLELYRNLWGVPGPRAAALDRVEAAGYDGVEAVLFNAAERRALKSALQGRPLAFKAVVWTRGGSVADHLTSFRRELRELLKLNPASIGTIGGSDQWTDDETARYFEAVLKLEAETGLPFAHETHRGSALFHPAVTVRMLRRFPTLRLTCDFSHWVVVGERLLDDQLATIRLCGRHATHLHVRVGTEQMPQVPDLRLPSAAAYLTAFERWWTIVWDEQAKAGRTVTSLCPELGPPSYQPTDPKTGLPYSDLWDQCEWQKDRQVERFRRWQAKAPSGRPRTRG